MLEFYYGPVSRCLWCEDFSSTAGALFLLILLNQYSLAADTVVKTRAGLQPTGCIDILGYCRQIQVLAVLVPMYHEEYSSSYILA